MNLGDLLPHNQEAEASVLGACLIDPDAVARVASIVQSKDFYDERHQEVFSAMLALHNRGIPVDFVVLCDELGERLQHIEPAYLTDLINTVPTSIHADHYARIVSDHATRRRLIDAATEIARLAGDLDTDADTIQDKAMEIITRARKTAGRRLSVSIRQALSAYYDRIEILVQRGGGMIGVPTGYTDLDRVLGGLQQSDLVILAARPSVGKTSLALGIAHNTAKLGLRVAFFSLEMSEEQIVQRLISLDSAVGSTSLREGCFGEHELEAVMGSMGRLSDLPIHINESSGIAPAFIRAEVARIEALHGPVDLIVVDYLQLMRCDGKQRDRYETVTEVSQGLKAAAKDLKIPVLALSQLSRSVETRADKRPILSDLRESGGIEQDSDVVMFIYRDEMYDENTERKNIADVIIAKHRNGPTGAVSLFFQKHLAKFQNADIRVTTIGEGGEIF